MTIYTKISGISFYQETLKKCKSGDSLILKRDLNNQYDKNAVAIYTISNELLGYINPTHNMKLSIDLEKGIKFECHIENISGQNQKLLGCNISIWEKIPKVLTINDGFTKFKVNFKTISFEFQNQTITIKNEDFEKCYNHFKVEREK